MSRVSRLARLGGGLDWVLTMRWQPFNEVIAGRKVGWVLEADIKNFFGSLDHKWMLRFVEQRVADPGAISLIRRWVKAGVMEDGELRANEQGTPQGVSISVLLSNLYLHYVLDLLFDPEVKAHLHGEALMIHYIDDFVICFQYRSDALRVQEALRKRLGRFGLALEPTKTKLIEFGRFAQRHEARRERRRPEKIYFLGFTLYCMRNLKGNFKVGIRTEKSRLERSVLQLRDLMWRMRQLPIGEQVINLNRMLRGHHAYYGIAGNFRGCKRCIGPWNCIGRKCSAAAAVKDISLGKYSIGSRFVFLWSYQGWLFPIRNCNHSLFCESISGELSAGNPHATFCGSWRRVTASDDPVVARKGHYCRDSLI